MYKGVLDQNWIRNFLRSIGYPILISSKLYEDKKSRIKSVLENRITPQVRSLDVLITALYELHIWKHLKWWTQDQTCNLLTSTPRSKAEKSSGTPLTSPLDPDSNLLQGQNNTKTLSSTCLMDLHIYKNHVSCIMCFVKPAQISYVRNCTTNTRVNQK